MIARRIIEYFKWIEGIHLRGIAGLIYKITTRLDNFIIKKEKLPLQVLNKTNREKKIIISLTSFPARIDHVHLAIKSLMLQTCKPDRIILWLAESQFPQKRLPCNLKELENYGLEIIWCQDMKSHKKYVDAINNQKENELIITYDDDIIYSPRSVERLIRTHKTHPNCIICERAQSITFNNGRIINPHRWDTLSNIGVSQPSYALNPSLGGGCLFPYKSLNSDATNWDLIQRFALYDDDVWIMYMAALNSTPFLKTRKYHRIFSTIMQSQDIQLAHVNILNNIAEDTFLNLSREYPIAYQRITGESK